MSGRPAARLSPDVRPERVDLHLQVDPATSTRFRGEVAIDLHLARPRREIELHAVDLTVSHPRVEGIQGDEGRTLRGRLEARPERETVVVVLPERLPPGPARLHLSFRGRLRKDLRGLYAARSGERRYAFTQLEATEARRFFPCFDEPGLKARFRIAVTTAEGHTVLSNAPAQDTERHGDGRATVRFRETPPLSTYLMALAVGELEASEPVTCGKTPIRVWHVPGRGHLTAFALETARETLARLERYFDLPYPYEKLDLVAVPDFEAGAMENAGAVFFRETLLLTDPATVTLGERKRVAEVICHELAHMWYGDLVTMAWWDDLWLNEAFATWMAFHVVDDWRPDWRMWNNFAHARAAALDLDALSTTHPVYIEVRTPEEATANFDLITYEKGAAVVRMIERYLGPATFRKGVRRYIRRHREGNATAADLWQALSEASGQDVAPVVRAWIQQPGFPLVALRRAGPRLLELRQERFRLAAGSRPDRPDRTRWPVPWVGRAGGRRERRLLERARERVELAEEPRFVYGNADTGGFFRVLHEPGELERLARHRRRLGPAERMGLLGDQWAAVRAGRAGLEGWLSLAGAFGDEPDPDVLAHLRGTLAFIEDQIARDDTRPGFGDWIVETWGGQLLALGWDPAPEEADETRLRRAAVIGLLGGVADWDPVVAAAEGRFAAYLDDRASLDANLADPVVSLAARRADPPRYAALLEASEKAETPQERRRFLLGLGSVTAPRLVERTLRLSLTETVPTQDVAFLLVRLLQNRHARERTWEFLRGRWERVRRRLPPMLGTRVIEATPHLQTLAARRQVAEHFRAHPLPAGERALRQALERFGHNTALRRRAAPALKRWLASRS